MSASPSRKREQPVACLICRSRKVRCDKTPSGCVRCRTIGVPCPGYAHSNLSRVDERVNSIYQSAGLERRRTGACHQCRAAKFKCSRSRPKCSRCVDKSLACEYPRNSKENESSHSDIAATRDAAQALLSFVPSEDLPTQSNLSNTSPVSALSGHEASLDAPPQSRSMSWLFEDSLPEPREMRLLVDSFFKHIHPLRNLGFIHKPSFMRDFDNGNASQEYGEGVMHLICALGARHLESSLLSRTENQGVPGRAWCLHARKLARMNCSFPSIRNLMLLVLYCELGLRTGDNAFVYMLVGCCTRMARLLHLDIEEPSSSATLDAERWVRQETRVRLMWTCYLLDSLVGAGVDANLGWRATAPDVRLACSENSFLLSSPENPKYLNVSLDGCDGVSTEVRGQTSRLCFLRSQVLRLIRNEGFAQTEGKAPPWQPNSPFNRLLDLLHQWHSHLPPFLEFNDMNMYVQKELSNLSSFFTLHLMYHSCIFDLTRVTLAGYSFPLAAAMASAPIDAKKRYQLMAWEHAVEVSDLLNKSFECGSGALDDYFVPTAAFESTKIQVIYSTTVANGDADIYARTASNINTNLHVLTATHPFVDMPNIYLSALCPFLARFGFANLASQWAPFQNTVLPAPGQGFSNDESTEVVGPVEASYLNQIATFRLARCEIDEQDKKGGAWELLPSAPASPRGSALRNIPSDVGHSAARGVLDGSGTGATTADHGATHVNSGVPGLGSAQGLDFMLQEPMAEAEFCGATQGTEFPSLDQEQYQRIAEEIGNYMTWDATIAPGWDFSLETPFDF